MKASTAYAISKTYTNETADEFGAVKGASCQISNIDYDASGNTVIDFLWENSAGQQRTSQAIIQKGKDADLTNLKQGQNIIITDNGDGTITISASGEMSIDYSKATNKPSINGVEIDGNKTTADLKIESGKIDVIKVDGTILPITDKTVNVDLSGKVDKVTGKGLSTNDYDDTEKAEVAKIANKVDKETGKSLVADTDITQITTNKNAIEKLNGTGDGSVSKQIADEIGKLTYLTKEIATKTEIDGYVADPTKAKFNVIYLLKDASAKGSDKYFEYQRIGDATTSTFEQTGDTSTDLTDYAKSEDVVAIQQKTEDAGKALIVGVDGKITTETIATDTSKVEKIVADNWQGEGCNLIPFPYYDGTTKTKDGITYTAFESGEVLAVGIGTSNLAYYITQAYNFTAGTYRLSGCPKGGSDTTYYQYVQNADSAFSMIAKDIGEGATFTLDTDTRLRVGLYILSGYDANITFKPMITKVAEDGSYPTEYQRYASGNVELTDEISQTELELVELKMLGWTVPKECEIQNAVSGNQFTQNVGRVDLGTLDFAYDTTNSWFYVKDLSLNAKSFPNTDVFNGYCANYENKSRNALVTEEGIGINTTSTIIVKDSNYSDADTFKNAVKGVYLYFELATPIEKVIDGNEIISDNADWLGNNNILSDASRIYAYITTESWAYATDSYSVRAKCEPNTTYTISTKGTSNIFRVCDIASDSIPQSGMPISANNIVRQSSTTNPITITTSNEAKYIIVQLSLNASEEAFATMQIEKGSSATPFKPFSKSNVELAKDIKQKELELAELKMLGWNVPSECPIQNTVSGNTFTQKVGRVELGHLAWAVNSYSSKPYSFVTHDYDVPDAVVCENTDDKVRCYSPDFDTDSAVNTIAKAILYKIAVISQHRIYMYSSKETADDLKAELQDKYLYYELATPITTQIDGNELLVNIPDLNVPKKVIPSGTDLDSFLNLASVGVYCSPDSTTTNSLVNCPITGQGFRMVVSTDYNKNVIEQRLIGNLSKDYTRSYTISSSAQTSWRQNIVSVYTKDEYGVISVNNGVNDENTIRVYNDKSGGTNGSEVIFSTQGNTFISAGESGTSLRNVLVSAFDNRPDKSATSVITDLGENYARAGENLFASADGHIYLESGVQTATSRKVAVFDTSGNLRPATTGTLSIGHANYKWQNAYINNINGVSFDNIVRRLTSSMNVSTSIKATATGSNTSGYASFLTLSNLRTNVPCKVTIMGQFSASNASSGNGFGNIVACKTSTGGGDITLMSGQSVGTILYVANTYIFTPTQATMYICVHAYSGIATGSVIATLTSGWSAYVEQ